MTLLLYLTRNHLAMIAAATLVLGLLGLSLDLLRTTTDLLQEAGGGSLGVYALLRAPVILASIFPIGVLCGAVLAFRTLARRSEMVAMRSSGVSTLKVLLLLGPCALLLGLVHQQLLDRVAPLADDAVRGAFPVSAEAAEVGAVIWGRGPGWIVTAELGRADGTLLLAPVIWSLDAAGLVSDVVEAERAEWIDGDWALSPEPVARGASDAWRGRLTPRTVLTLASAPLATSTATAKEALEGSAVAARGRAFYETLLAQSYAALVAPAVLVLLAAMASFDTRRGGAGVARAIVSILAGFAYVVTSGVLATLSEVGAMHPAAAAAAPAAVFTLIGVWALLVLEET
ncbi:MAG: LptF/LptG family permease [Pseudomonadota bacterium]